MDDSSTTILDQAEEEILTYTVTDEALEAAGGTEGRLLSIYDTTHCP